MADATERLNAMLAGIHENARLVEAIAAASHQQSAAIGEVTSAVRQMDEMTQHNAALVEETNAAIEQTESQATELDRIVAVFVTADGVEAQQGRGASAPGARKLQARLAGAARSFLTQGNAALKHG